MARRVITFVNSIVKVALVKSFLVVLARSKGGWREGENIWSRKPCQVCDDDDEG